MLRKSEDLPYSSRLVTIIWKENNEWNFCTSKSEKRLLVEKKPKEIMAVWTGQYSSDVFEVDFNKLAEV